MYEQRRLAARDERSASGGTIIKCCLFDPITFFLFHSDSFRRLAVIAIKIEEFTLDGTFLVAPNPVHKVIKKRPDAVIQLANNPRDQIPIYSSPYI